ncbi:MAG: hypothetical protein JRN06_10085 [Nitrososphaerota archaeon]|nr:hypothetical protein [Nitrososphaerota archaeon]MDG7024936.1 hypothetical protein [Nitrososphaerota archaeon]
MWLEIIVGGGLVTFSNAGVHLNRWGKDPRLEWASRVEAEAQRTSGKTEGVEFLDDEGDLRIHLHRDAVPSVIRAIDKMEPSMPQDVVGFFQRISYLLENSDELGATVRDLGLVR